MPDFVIADFATRRADEALLRDVLGPPKRAPVGAEALRAACAAARLPGSGRRRPWAKGDLLLAARR